VRARPILLIACALLTQLAVRSAGAEPTRSGAIDVIILWDASLPRRAQDPLELGAFLGTIREGDRVGMVGYRSSGARITAPLDRITAAESRSRAYELLDRLGDADQERADLAAGLRQALEHLEKSGDQAALRSVLVVGGAGSVGGDDAGAAADAGPVGIPEKLLADFLLQEIIVHCVARLPESSGALAALAAAAGGKSVALTDDQSLADALALAYESLQLSAIELARKRPAEDAAPADDYSFLDETRSIEEIEASIKERRSDQRAETGPGSPLPTALLATLLALSALSLALLVFLSYRTFRAGKDREPSAGKRKELLSPSFSKLTLGLNQFTRIYDEAGEKLRTLSLDLEDFGAASWEIEKRMLDSYVSVADNLFLLIDHLEVQSRGGGTSAESDWFLMRLRQILEDESIAEIEAAMGDEFDGRIHSRADDREDEAAPGTVLEVVRKGYVRKQAPTGDELVLRQAEVVVSRGIAGSGEAGGGSKED
jgi:hypothetical protein